MSVRETVLPVDETGAAPTEHCTHAIRVLLASPEAAERLGLATIVAAQEDMELVAQAALAEEAARLLATHRPDVVVIDAGLLEPCLMDGLSEHAGDRQPPRLLVLVMHSKGDGVQRALQARAQGIVLRGMNYLDFLDAIRAVHGGKLYSPEMAAAREGEPDGGK